MDNQTNPADKVVSDLQKNFTVVGSRRVHAWYAWAAIGLVLGALITVAYLADRSGRFSSGSAAVSMRLDPMLEASRVGQILNEYAERDGLESASIEFAETTERDNEVLLRFNEPAVFYFDDPMQWQVFQEMLVNSIRGPRPFELTLNPILSNSSQVLVVGPNLDPSYASYFTVSASVGGGTGNYDPRCYCDSSVSFTVSCTDSEGNTSYLLGPEPGGDGQGVTDKDGKPTVKGWAGEDELEEAGSSPTVWTTGFKGKSSLCYDSSGKSQCSKDACAALALPDPKNFFPADDGGKTKCKFNYQSINDGKNSGLCQDVVKG